MQDSIDHVIVTLFCSRVFGVKTSSFFNIYATLLWVSFHNVTKISTWRYINPRRDVI